MRHARLRVLLPIALLNIFVLASGFVVRDIALAAPPTPQPHPLLRPEAPDQPAAAGTSGVDADRLAQLLDDRMSASGISDGLSAYVVDVATGDELYARDPLRGAVPASTTKIATGLAALAAVGADERISTSVELDAETVVLVGGGDPTLTATREPGDYPRLATLAELAEQTADALHEEGVDTVSVGYDDSYYTGAATGPGWKPNYVPEGSVAPVHALMIDTGHADPGDPYSARHDDPPRAAAEAFAGQLREAGLTVEGEVAPRDGGGSGEVVAEAASPTIATLVEMMMIHSENNIAEALAFQVAAARGEEASFDAAGPAVAATVTELGVSGVEFSDGSGLSVDNEMTAEALVDMLRLAGDPEQPELRSVLSGLPVAHASGTLTGRYSPQSEAAAAAGWLRAKTGTLDGVSTLAGVATHPSGHQVAFAFLANNPIANGAALDGIASALVECDC